MVGYLLNHIQNLKNETKTHLSSFYIDLHYEGQVQRAGS